MQMKLNIALTALLALGAATPQARGAGTGTAANSATNRPASAGREHRYLVVVETSKATGKRADGIDHTILDVLGTGLKGQVKRGDTLGVWTFNEQLITGKFPLQKWGPDNQAKVATSVVEFLKKQKFEKQGLPEKMLATLGRVVTNSELITVVLISSGNADLSGTPFDDRINGVYQQWRAQQQEKKMPFLTLFRGRHGVLTDYAVSPAPWPAELPPLPPEPVAQAKPAASPAPKPPTAAPLYFSGKKSGPQPAPAQSAATAAASGLPKVSSGNVAEPSGTNGTATAGPTVTSTPAAPAMAAAKVTEALATLSTNSPATSGPPAALATAPLPPTPPTPSLATEPPANSQVEPLPANAAAPGKTEAEPAPPQKATVAATSPAPQDAPATATRFSANAMLLAITCCAFGALLAVLMPRLLRQRARHEQVSLITRSFDRTAR